MPDPLPLKLTATIVCMRALLLENRVEISDDSDSSEGSTPYLMRLLETDCFTAVSEEILHRIIKFCPEGLTNRLLHALLPPYIQNLNLNYCLNVKLMKFVKTLTKCKHIHRANLSYCTQLILPELFTFMGLTNIPLTTVKLEGNESVTDEVVHEMLINLPGLETLNISCCSNITNNVFLLDEDLQTAREVTIHPLKGDQFKCNLTDVDISGCRTLGSQAIIHLTSLCGPKLRSLDISWTSIHCTGLLYLAGYSLPAIIDFMLTDDALKSDKELKPVLQSYREIRDTYVEQYENESKGSKEQDTIEENKADIVVETDIKLEMAEGQSERSPNEECHIDNANIGRMLDELNLEQEYQEGMGSNENQQNGKTLGNSGNMEKPRKRKRIYYRNNEIVAVYCPEHGENCESDSELEDTDTNKNVQKPAVCDKLNFDYDLQLYQPKILSLNIYGIQFLSRRPYLGQLCLEKFLEANKSLKKFSVSWRGLTSDYFRKVVHNLTELIEVELEECTLLQEAGIEALGRNCCKLQSVNLRGVVFFSDRALVPFLNNKNLQSLQLAESPNITDAILIKFSECLSESLTSIDLSICEEITEKGLNAICSCCTNLKRLWIYKCPVSDFMLKLLSEAADGLVEISVESADQDDDNDFLTNEGILTIANTLTNLRVINISWNLVITNLSVSAIMLNCCLLEEANFKGLKLITIEPFLPIISGGTDCFMTEESASQVVSDYLLFRSTTYAPNLRVLDLDYSDLVDEKLLQKIVNVCRGTLQVTDYYGEKLEPEC